MTIRILPKTKVTETFWGEMQPTIYCWRGIHSVGKGQRMKELAGMGGSFCYPSFKESGDENRLGKERRKEL